MIYVYDHAIECLLPTLFNQLRLIWHSKIWINYVLNVITVFFYSPPLTVSSTLRTIGLDTWCNPLFLRLPQSFALHFVLDISELLPTYQQLPLPEIFNRCTTSKDHYKSNTSHVYQTSPYHRNSATIITLHLPELVYTILIFELPSKHIQKCFICSRFSLRFLRRKVDS